MGLLEDALAGTTLGTSAGDYPTYGPQNAPYGDDPYSAQRSLAAGSPPSAPQELPEGQGISWTLPGPPNASGQPTSVAGPRLFAPSYGAISPEEANARYGAGPQYGGATTTPKPLPPEELALMDAGAKYRAFADASDQAAQRGDMGRMKLAEGNAQAALQEYLKLKDTIAQTKQRESFAGGGVGGANLPPGQEVRTTYDAKGQPKYEIVNRAATGAGNIAYAGYLDQARRELGNVPQAQLVTRANELSNAAAVGKGAAAQQGKFEGLKAAVDIPTLATALAGGQMSRDDIANAFGVPVRSIVEGQVLKQYPNFNFSLMEANAKWAINPSNQQTIGQVQAVLPRLNMLTGQLASLPNTSIPAINAIIRQVSLNAGQPAYADFESNRNAIVQEVNRALAGSATTSDLRIRIELENLTAARSPAQITAALGNLREALISRLDASLSPIYPLDVVRGEKTREQFVQEMGAKYRGKYGVEGGPAPGGGTVNIRSIRQVR